MSQYEAIVRDLRRYKIDLDGQLNAPVALLDAIVQELTTSRGRALSQQYEAGEVTPDNVGDVLQQHTLSLLAEDHKRESAAALRGSIYKSIAAILRRNEDGIVIALRPAWDAAARVVEKAISKLGVPASLDPAIIVNLSPEAVAAYQQLPDALTTLSGIRTLRVDVGNLANRAQDVSDYLDAETVRDSDHLAVAARRLDGLSTGVRGGVASVMEGMQGVSPWLLLASEGFRLKLNTPSEAQALRDQVAEVESDRPAARHPLVA
jgi:hypothetical protein